MLMPVEFDDCTDTLYKRACAQIFQRDYRTLVSVPEVVDKNLRFCLCKFSGGDCASPNPFLKIN